MSIEINIMKGFIKFSISVLCALAITACEAKEPEMVGGLAGVVFNYSQDWIGSVHINGHTVGRAIDDAKVGQTKGGGGSICCSLALSPTDGTVEALVKTSEGDYTTKATIEHPWPSDPDTVKVHILPGRKIVIEVGYAGIGGRKDLLEAQIKALGLKQEMPFSDLMRSGPHEYTEYYQSKK